MMRYIAPLLVLFALCSPLPAHDMDHPEEDQWYANLRQPDNPALSCCGIADAYWADSFEVNEKGEYVAIITDTRPDAPSGRVHVEVGTKIVVPNAKLVDATKQQNPTGHGVIFLSRGGPYVYCYLAPGGV